MKTKTLISVLVPILLFCVSSCTPEGLEREPSTLEISQTDVSLTEEGGEKVIAVTTNQDKLIAISNDESWLTAVPQEGGVKLLCAENPGVTSREASVIVMAGEATGHIKVTQSGAKLNILTVPETIVLDPWSSSQTISIKVNSEKWTVSTADKWLNASALPWKNEVILTTEDNGLSQPRTTELMFQVEGKEGAISVVVTQKPWPVFMLPFLDFEHGTKSTVSLFERNRRSEVDKVVGSQFIDFNSISPLFPRISYTFSTRGILQYAQTDVAESYTTWDSEGNMVMTDETIHLIDSALLAEGFVEKRGTYGYYDAERRILAQVKPQFAFNPHVLYSYIPKQPRAYKTFETLPYPPLDFGSSHEEVDKYEKVNGGVYDPDGSEYNEDQGLCFIAYDVPKSKEIKSRNYFMTYKDETVGQLVGYMCEWRDFNLVYYDYNGEFYVTDEFTALMASEGFKYSGKTDDGKMDVFVSAEKGVQLRIQFVFFEGEDDPSLMMMYLPYQQAASSSGMNRASITSRIDRFTNKVLR